MLHLTSQTQILVATQPVDFRKQIDGLVAICEQHFKRQPNDGVLYVFINRAKTRIKVLYYDKNGYWLAMKRLSRGRYSAWPRSEHELTSMLAHDLRELLKKTTCKRS